jgi:2-oxoglutarate/2-oxoacid ferredoxin oxidoreductase subunit alpha
VTKQVKQLDRVIIRFAGDSGDGMQLTGDRFTQETAAFGNDLSTLPNFPAEIRAPQGTLPGVSSFQVHFADHDILTPGDSPDVLVAMNPAALKANLGDLKKGATVIVDSHDFTNRNLNKAGYAENPLENDSLSEYDVHAFELTDMTVEAVREFGLSRKDAGRAKNMFALGMLSWMYGRPTESTISFLERRFAKAPDIRDANVTAFRAGWNFGETTEAFVVQYEIKPAPMVPGTYRNITGNLALAYGLVAGSTQSGLPLFLGSYPITPASDILHELSKHKRFGVTTFQAEDEIAGIGAALGAAFGGALGVTTTSGPGIALKSETIGLGVMMELPLLVVDVQRGGPSTGLPTKTEQADLLQAMFGRNGEAPVPIIAPQSPADCFDAALEATRIAVTYRTPVLLLSDGYLANGSEPWQIPEVADLPTIDPKFATETKERRSSGPTCATRTPWPGRGRFRAPRVSSTGSAAWRRARGTATSPTTPPTTTSWCAPARPRCSGSPTTCLRWRSTTPPVRPPSWCSGGGRRTARSVPRSARSATPDTPWRRRTCDTSTRSRRTSVTSSRGTTP